MPDSRRPILPNPPRWQPNPDPSSIQVPGLDTTASVLDQVEQMEQLITIKLQNIDENFSKIHNLLANKLLPAVKRYAVGTEPVREAAKFWTSFYEQAAQIRIPSFDDYSSVNEHHSQAEHQEMEAETQSNSEPGPSHSNDYEPNMTSTESSFMPGQAAFSSTPATATRHRATHPHNSFASESSEDPSWTASMESPLVRLDRELQNFSREDEGHEPSLSLKVPSLRYDEPLGQHDQVLQPRADKGKGKEPSEPLLRNVLRQNLYSTSETSSGAGTSAVSPIKSKGKTKTPVPKTLNPYLPPNTNPADWSGLVDLSDPSLATPLRQRYGRSSSRRNPVTPIKPPEDDSFDGLPPGMSPPVLMSPARPPRSSAELGLLKLGQTPTKEAAARITRDLVSDAQRQSGRLARKMYGYGNSGVESSMSTVPTPPSLSRYSRHEVDSSDSMAMDPSLESMMRRVGLNFPSSAAGSTPGLRLRSTASRAGFGSVAAAAPSFELATPVQAHPHPDSDSDSDSLDEVHNTAHPSAAFLMASQGLQGSDDSFGSSNHSGDSLTEEDANLGLAPVHPFAGGMEDDGFDDDDTFDDDGYEGNPGNGAQEETLFGVPPVQRLKTHARGVGQQVGPGNEHLRMLGEDLLQDTIGIGAQIARTGRVEESPTPASWAGGSRS